MLDSFAVGCPLPHRRSVGGVLLALVFGVGARRCLGWRSPSIGGGCRIRLYGTVASFRNGGVGAGRLLSGYFW
jgi:hypothetical protein